MDQLSACAKIAARQHGVISRRQALDAGVRSNAIDRLLHSRAWAKLHPRVYALWVPDNAWLQLLMAGTLWLGTGSGVSHRAAAVLRDLDGFETAALEFSTTGRCRSVSRGLIVHKVRRLPQSDLGLQRDIPVTSVTRTLIDLGAVARRRDLELAFESALRRGLTT
ncbi:MAG: type IV toxin-antitoxin system AbiEi family antitoxin domain-containing protein, partial [Actinomycetota bacterium]